jgi:uncharacterized repeat protein (TIGR04076 family)
MAKLKISVLKKLSINDVYGEKLPVGTTDIFVPTCGRFEEGQEFIMEGPGCPPDFCNWAFADIQRDLVHIWAEGDYPWIQEKGTAISCCTDGLRPVFFKIERIPD